MDFFEKRGYDRISMRGIAHRYSAIAFFSLGSLIFLALFLLRMEIASQFSVLFLRLIDTPFVFFALLYGGLSLRSFFEEEHHPVLDGVIVLIGLLLFSLYLYGNLAYPDLI